MKRIRLSYSNPTTERRNAPQPRAEDMLLEDIDAQEALTKQMADAGCLLPST